MDLTTVIKIRRSIREYQEKEIPDNILDEILDCARMAPTAMNLQPWLIGCVTDKRLLESIAELADHGKFIRQAAACFTVFCRKDVKYYLEDGCAATMNIILGAAAKGIGTCWVAGDKKTYAEDIRKLLNVPEEYTLVSLVSAGYAMNSPRPIKKDIKEISFKNKYR